MNNLPRLASLLKSRDTIDSKIAHIIGHPTQIQSVGEYIASVIFGVVLDVSPEHKERDGRFTRGPLMGHTVDVQWRTRHDSILHVKTDPPPDYYLVFVGSKEATAIQSLSIPWVIESVHLFDASELLLALHERGVQIGTGTSITGPLWEHAEIYPAQNSVQLQLTGEERELLTLFR